MPEAGRRYAERRNPDGGPGHRAERFGALALDPASAGARGRGGRGGSGAPR
ncbi:MAG: hypothetical protein MZW92_81435 [Comamonadaceae bacterium]|nr:hypothetical protein [Comamonadaceae bacterium]